MSAASGTVPPPVSWAQRNDVLYVIIDVECNDVQHKVTENSLHFSGVNCLDSSKKYDVTLNFLHPVDPERVSAKNIGRCLEFTIFKKEAGPYWPSLTTDKTKLHFLKANFSKWKDESDDDGAGDFAETMPFNDVMNWNKKFDDFNVDDDDSDDNIPSLSQNDEDDDDEDEEVANEKGKGDKIQENNKSASKEDK